MAGYPGHHRVHAGSAPGAPDAARAPRLRCWWPRARRSISTWSSIPDYFFGRSPEHAYINPDNLEILLAHLKCAAFELPLRDGETFGPHEIGDLCRFLEEAGFLHHSAGAWHWTSDSYPADAISLRVGFERQLRGGRHHRRAQGDRRGVVHRGAHHAARESHLPARSERQYHVERFDYEERKAYVRRVDCDYYTDAIDYTQVKTLAGVRRRADGRRAARARRRAREPADRRLQEDQVLHQGKRGRGQALDARAGDAHHRVLAALPGGVSGAVRRFHAHRAAERHQPGWATRCARWRRCC